MSEYAKNIQTIEDLWRKRIELQREGGGLMSEYIIELPNGGAADECIRLRGYEKSLYGYELREEIVRCRDCKHADEIMTRYAGMQYACMRFDDATVTPDGFCAWAERREP